MKTIRVGLAGLGTVGAGVLHILGAHARELERRTGTRLELTGFASRTPARWSELGLDATKCSADPMDLARHPNVDILIEVMGGVETARNVVLEALASGKDVVTANKALLAEKGDEIFKASAENGRMIGFEASVCGGLPIIHLLKRSLAAERIQRIVAIVNGTCNYILTHMIADRRPFDEVLKEAQSLGYAEADPTLDINGGDSAHKLALLSMLGWGVRLDHAAIPTAGIEALPLVEVAYAAELKMVIKLLACARMEDDGRLALSVGPALVPAGSVIGQVHGAVNAVLVDGDHVGPIVMSGAGAGQMPTANAVVADLLDIARLRAAETGDAAGPTGFPESSRGQATLVPREEQVAANYLRITAMDVPGILAEAAGALAERGISIAQVHQHGRGMGGSVPVVILTHEAKQGDLDQAVRAIDAMPKIKDKTVVMRVVEEVP